MNELDHRRQLMVTRTLIAKGASYQQHQRQACAAATHVLSATWRTSPTSECKRSWMNGIDRLHIASDQGV